MSSVGAQTRDEMVRKAAECRYGIHLMIEEHFGIAPAELQRSRALARPGMTEEKLESILAKQMPDSEKRKRADFVVDSSQGLDYARQQVEDIIESVTQSA